MSAPRASDAVLVAADYTTEISCLDCSFGRGTEVVDGARLHSARTGHTTVVASCGRELWAAPGAPKLVEAPELRPDR